MEDSLAILTSLPGTLDQTRSAERPQNGPYNRTVSTTVNMYTNFPPLPYSYTLISIFIGMFCVLFYIHNHPFVCFFLFHKSNRHICHGAYSCTHNLAHILILRFLLHSHLCDSYVCVRQSAYALPSSSIPIHIYRQIDMYACFDHFVMTPCKLYTPIKISFCVPTVKG